MDINASAAPVSRATGRGRALHPGWVAFVLATAAILGIAILAVHFGTQVDVNLLLTDPAEQGSLPFYTGAYTYLGAVALFSALAVCLFAASLLDDHVPQPLRRSFLISLGALAAWLGLDDLFMFHEWAGLAIAEMTGQDGDSGARSRLEGIVFVAYGAAWLAWMAAFWRAIRTTAWVLLLLALAGLAASVAVDVGMFLFPERIPDTAWMPTTLAVAEEMLKLTGVFFLLAYAVDTSRASLRGEITRT